VSFRVAALIERRMHNDKAFRQRVISTSNEWKKGDMHLQPAQSISNWTDGVVARSHPHLLRRATDDEVNDVRVGIFLEGDDVEVPCPMPHAATPSQLHTCTHTTDTGCAHAV
jgi:hypothetical protein